MVKLGNSLKPIQVSEASTAFAELLEGLLLATVATACLGLYVLRGAKQKAQPYTG